MPVLARFVHTGGGAMRLGYDGRQWGRDRGLCEESYIMAFAIFDGLFGSDDPVSPLSNPDAGTGTAVLERPEEETKLDDGGNGDADRFAHYVSRDRIAESKMTGRPVVALCGKVWVPKRDPTHYPVCPDCKRIYDEMMNSSF